MKDFFANHKAKPILFATLVSIIFLITGLLSKGIVVQYSSFADILMLLEVSGLVFYIFFLGHRVIFNIKYLKSWTKYRNLIFLLFCLTVLMMISFLSFTPSVQIDYNKFVSSVVAGIVPMIFGVTLVLYSIEERLTKKIDCLSIKLPGYLEAVRDASSFQLEGEIFGWNPNWALELNISSTDIIYQQLERTHIERLTREDVTSIQYVFLDEYKPPSIETLCFGTQYFFNFLARLYAKNNTINLAKYEIWKIPKAIWEGTPASAEERGLKELIKEFLHVVVIAGTKDGNPHSRIFFNMRPFVATGGHTHCLKIQDNGVDFNPIQTSLFEKMKKCNIRPQKISVDSSTKALTLKEHVD